MKILIIGGTGLIGSGLVATLRAEGHEVVPAAPNTGVNTLTGEGLREAMDGADVVIDVSNSPSFDDAPALEFFTTSARNITAAEKAAGVRHHVALSVVGTQRMTGSGYMRAKAVQEEQVKAAGVPYSIVQSTQFMEFMQRIADGFTTGTEVRVPPVPFQPIAAGDVVKAVARTATGAPLNGTIEIAGPQVFRADKIIGQVLAGRNDPRTVVADPGARYFGAILDDTSLVPGKGAQLGEVTLEEFESTGKGVRP